MKELIEKIVNRNFTIQGNQGTIIVGGIDSVRWLGCDNTTGDSSAFQVLFYLKV